MGRLDDFQRHKVRVWAQLQPRISARLGRLDIAPLYRFNSARTFSLRRLGVALSAQQIARNPGYARLPASQTFFFGARGSPAASRAFIWWTLPRPTAFRSGESLRPWVKVEVLNALNNQKLIAWNTAVTADNAGPKDDNGLPLNYIKCGSVRQQRAPRRAIRVRAPAWTAAARSFWRQACVSKGKGKREKGKGKSKREKGQAKER